jgi:hypothetical protein|tara:strand:+ start:4476 stop:4895 length:420 start_codon:yes stop_codon:yes gene_type:complete
MTGQQKQTFTDLNRWADFLEDVPDGNFCMATWKSGYDPLNINKMDGGCGTTACAGGWATVIPQFKRRGLVLKWHDNTDAFVMCFKHYRGYDAIAEFFGISDGRAMCICAPGYYDAEASTITIADVVQRINEVIKDFSPE